MLDMNSKLKEMTFKQKARYFWDYYKSITIVVIVAIILVISLIKTISFNKMKYDSYCLILNDPNNSALADRITEGFPTYLNNEKYLINVDYAYPFAYSGKHGINWPDESSTVKFMALMGTNKADVAIADKATLLWAVYEKYIYPMDEVLPKDLMQSLKPYYVYADFQGEESNDGVVYGLNISDTEVYKGYSNKYDSAVVFLPNLTVDKDQKGQHLDEIEFIKYLYGIK